MGKKVIQLQNWFKENVFSGLVIALLLFTMGSFVDTKNGFANLHSETKASIATQDQRIEGYVQNTSIQIKQIKTDQVEMRTEFLSEIREMKRCLDKNFKFLIELQQNNNNNHINPYVEPLP